MKVLLHACCADCTLKFIESIKTDKSVAELVLYYYNPNIHPRSEYQSRLKAIKQIAEENKIKLIIPDWRPSEYFERVTDKNKPSRCINCWNLRLNQTAKYAKENGFEMFASTLVTSQYQDNKKINEIALSMAIKYGVEFYIPKLICTELKTSGFYKQSFCGCCYSLTERMTEKHGSI
jgi:predicted adenine nucleotide alpha hydrolase (AANH) superfamily ATPase